MIDLYLGSDVGLWAMEQTPVEQIHQVLTLEEKIAAHAKARGVRVVSGDANAQHFEPAPVGLSVHYARILKPSLIARYRRLYNLHPGYLPWGRGFYPIFWALWEGTPAGATLHEITAGLDEGPIVAQIRVEQFPDDTGFTLFQRVREAEKQLYRTYLPRIVVGKELPAMPQQGEGSYHSRKEFYALKRPENWQSFSAEEIIRLIRSLSFPGYSGLELSLGGKVFSFHAEALEDRA